MTESEIEKIRADFPLIKRGKIIYFDNAATMQKPRQVIERVRKFYEQENASPLRGLYDLSVQAEENVAAVRAKVAKFMGAERAEEIVFTKNATEAINLTAKMFARKLTVEDNIVAFLHSHHSNFLPWVNLAEDYRIELSIPRNWPRADIPTNTELIVLPGISNVTGEELEVKRLPRILYSADLTQTIAHRRVNVVKEKIDFAQWSGHKIGAPMGVGVLYGRYDKLDEMAPESVGGGMVDSVESNNIGLRLSFAATPQRFEAGTINVEGILGLGAAIDYLEQHDLEKLFTYENELTKYAQAEMKNIPEIRLVSAKNGIVSFNVEGVHPHDTAQILADGGICVRAGYHCAQPLLNAVLGVGPVVRASFAFYNTTAEIDKMIAVLKTVRKKMGL
ncbi:aminotransferase class V-fold PLP-dependent enzyme [Candidatus Saccharibacteria bacterium]|nr:aminotransferase class V-fold PLP-dependent enzyme [Candidatus Saccharibacteria bacterium]